MKNLFLGLGLLLVLPLGIAFSLPGAGECRESATNCTPQEQTQSPKVYMRIISGCDTNTGFYTRSRGVRNWVKKCQNRNRARSRRTQARKSAILNREKPRMRALKRRVFSVRSRKRNLSIRRNIFRRYGRYNCSPVQKGC